MRLWQGELIYRLNPNRYNLHVADRCHEYHMPDSGMQFIRNNRSALAMMPPNWLNDQFPQTRPHLYNHWCSPQYGCWWMGRYIQHNHQLVWMNPLGMNARKIYLSAGMSAMKTDFRNTVPLDMLSFSGAKFIRYFQYYRPVPRPKMFWFTFD